MNKEMNDELLKTTKEVLAPELLEKENDTMLKLKRLSLIAQIYKFGPAPDNPDQVFKGVHPKNKKKIVRFIKQENGKLYFNVGDWLKPYKNKLFEKIVKSTVKPPANKRLDQLWMMMDAWQAIENAVKKNTDPIEIVKTWQSGRLF